MKKIAFVAMVLPSLMSCTREKVNTTVRIKLPESNGNLLQNVQAKGIGFNISMNPSTVSDINCYAIFVGGPDALLNQNNCYDSSTNAVKMRFGPSRFFIPAGTETSIEVPSGPSRQIYLVGLKSQGSSCVPLGPGQNPDSSNMSVPHIVSEKTIDLQPGETAIEMVRTIDSSKTFDNCNFMTGGGGSSLNLFGNGRDGNITVTGNGVLDFGTQDFSQDPDYTHTASTLPSPATKKASSTKRITNIDTVAANTLILDSAFSSNDFEVGDEIMWSVSSGWESANPDDNACGTGTSLFRGRFGFANIVGVPNSTTLVVDKALTAVPGSINNTNLSQANPVTGTPFCRMHVRRVPNFNKIDVAASTPLSFTTSAFDMTGGGSIVFRVNEIVLNSGSTFNISVDARGFNSSSNSQGAGVQGLGISSANSNLNGGGQGTSGNGGGGGGGSASGADGGGSPFGAKGSGVTFCIGATPCLPTRDQKAFFGGGGGGTSSFSGGVGGGIILIYAKKITGTGTITLSAKGGISSTSTGGGGGGTISFNVQQLPATITTIADASGGNGTSGTYPGGGGGGGAVEVKYCGATSSSTGITTMATGGTSAANPAGSNAPANAIEVANAPALCTAN